MGSRKKAIVPGLLVAGFVFWWYFEPLPWLGAVMALLAGFLTFYILSTGRMERTRTPFFIALFVFIFGTLIVDILYLGLSSFAHQVAVWSPGYYFPESIGKGIVAFPSPLMLPTIFWGGAEFLSGLGAWQTSLPTSLGAFFVFMIPYAVIFLVFGRAFCGWICPLGGLTEAMATGKKERWQLNSVRKKMVTTSGFGYPSLKGWVNAFRYVFLSAMILLSILLGFAIVNIFYPVLWLKSMPVFWSVVGVLVVFAIALPFMTKRRWWCYICPVGAIMSPLDKISPFRIKIDQEKCVKCMDCVHACRMYALTPQGVEKGEWESGYCIRCGRCIEACSEEAIDISWMGGQNKARAPFVALVTSTALALYVWYIVLLVSLISRIVA